MSLGLAAKTFVTSIFKMACSDIEEHALYGSYLASM